MAKKASLDERMVPGVKVRLSGKFLRSTMSEEGSKVWIVQECPCRCCKKGADSFRTVAINEPTSDLGYWSAEELAAMPYLKMRHVARSNLTIVGEPSARDVS